MLSKKKTACLFLFLMSVLIFSVAAYDKLTDLMARGKGDTPEAQEAYEEYKAAKKKYEALSQK